MPHPNGSVDSHDPCQGAQEGHRTSQSPYPSPLRVRISGTKRADMTPAQQVDPASYHSFIDLTTRHHDPERRNQASRARKHPRSRKPLQVVDRPTSFLDLGESDAQILYHPSYTPDLKLESAHDAGIVSALPPSVAISNHERAQGKPGAIDTNSPGPSSCDPTCIKRTETPFLTRSAPQACDLSSDIATFYSLHASVCLEDDPLPSYEEVAGSATVNSEERTVQQFASRYSGSPPYVDRARVGLLLSFQYPKSPPCNPVVPPAPQVQRAFRPLPPIPPSKQTHVYSTTPLDAGEQSVHIDELNVVPAKSPSKMKKAQPQRIKFGPNADHPKVQLS